MIHQIADPAVLPGQVKESEQGLESRGRGIFVRVLVARGRVLRVGVPSPADDYTHETLDFNRDNTVVYRTAKLPILTLDSGAAFDLTQLSPVNCGNQMTCVLTREGDTIYATISRKGFCISFR